MANGYDSLSLKATGLAEATSSSLPMSQMMPVAVRDKRFTRRGIGYRTQQEATTLDPGAVVQGAPEIMYPGGVATGRRGVSTASSPWDTAQEATSPQIRPRATLERFSSVSEALPPWLKGKEGDEEEKEAAVALVRENMGAFPCEADARVALAVLSQFVDGDILASVQDAIEDQFGDPMAEPPVDDYEYGDPDEDEYSYIGEGALQEAPLNADKRNKLPDSAFAIPGERAYPIDTPERARSALARVDQFGSDDEKRKVRAAVKKKYPDMDVK